MDHHSKGFDPWARQQLHLCRLPPWQSWSGYPQCCLAPRGPKVGTCPHQLSQRQDVVTHGGFDDGGTEPTVRCLHSYERERTSPRSISQIERHGLSGFHIEFHLCLMHDFSELVPGQTEMPRDTTASVAPESTMSSRATATPRMLQIMGSAVATLSGS